MHMDLPEQVKWIIRQLNSAGFEAFAVGGCVRDMLLHKEPMDWDITTNAKPEQVKQVFKKTVDTGIEHGTVTIIKNGKGYEVTTYRVDGEYEDSRHPKEVTFTTDIKDDLCRRDFTINAMAYNEQQGFVDCFGGIEDLQAQIIRCVGDPYERFTEDALRILRALRFSSQLEFEIEENTYKAAADLSPRLAYVSVERIAVELIKLLTGKCPEKIKDVFAMGIMKPFYSEKEDSDELMLKCLKTTKPVRYQRLAALFIGQEDAVAKRVLKSLKLDNDTIKIVSILTRHSTEKISDDSLYLRRMLNRYGEALLKEILYFSKAVYEASGDDRGIEICLSAEKVIRDIIEKGQCTSLKDLAVNGKDLIDAGVEPGKDVGNVLDKLMERVLIDPSLNEKQKLLSLLKNEGVLRTNTCERVLKK